MDTKTYRERQEDFVSNLTGTSASEVYALPSFAVILWLIHYLVAQKHANFFVDFCMLVVPFLLMLTILSDYVFHIVAIYALLAIFLLGHVLYPLRAFPVENLFMRYSGKLTFLSLLRANIILSTALLILAVDFPAFPRRFAKTEDYGLGLMDIGVGMYVVSNGLVSPQARFKTEGRTLGLKSSIISSLPILVIAFARLISTTIINYHLHISEYGRHWNFFFTLAAIKIGSSLLYAVIPAWLSLVLGPCIALVHQYLLTSCGLEKFVMNEDRNGLLAANKEGVVSALGYLAIYVSAVAVGRFLFAERKCIFDWLSAMAFLAIATIFSIVAATHLQDIQWLTSRRLVNFPYYIFTMSLTLLLLFLFLLAEVILIFVQFSRNKSLQAIQQPNLMSAINSNALLLFLVANLATGAVNMSLQTIDAADSVAITILIIYSLSISYLAHFMHVRNCKLKFW